ncbi:MAG: phenylalanine--tRNA ligase subunit beta [Clostridiaceae bacterium]|nr:phenylalanine--tRNA ligase subunit beta [Clostridiaceae bacterium]
MKLPYKWLKDFVDIGAETVSPKEYAQKMTMSGSMIGSWEHPADEIENVVCGKILSLEKHPDSDHLWVCQVDVGTPAPIQIVTGAQNLKTGDLTPAALDNSRLPGGTVIRSGKLRGVESNGMLCSMGELGLTKHDCPYGIEDGILVLEPDTGKPGDDIRQVLDFDEYIFDFDILHNRPDCLSVIGLARETAATFDKPLTLSAPNVGHTEDDIGNWLSVRIEAPDLCPRYTAAMVKDIRIAPSPKWMRDRLRHAGVRPINNIVDITNYVMLEYGQPMHAFDYTCIDDKTIIVRRGRENETTVTLDGQTRTLDSDTLVIADPEKCVGIAGVMGGENSEITDDTRRIVFESATFDPVSVRTSSRRMGMRTEASGRFEKGLDPENTLPALLRACQLVEQLDAGTVMGGIVDVYPEKKAPRVLSLWPERIRALLGADVPAEFMTDALRRLEFHVAGEAVTVPSWRGDVEGIADLAEEVGRLWGYDRIPTTLFAGRATRGGLTPLQQFRRRLASACFAAGYTEAKTLSFMSPKTPDRLCMAQDDPRRHAVRILNPLGEDQSLLRTSPLPALLDAAARNRNYRASALRLFESCTVYYPKCGADGNVLPSELPEERHFLTLMMYGGDFYDLKGAVETILAACYVPEPRFTPCTDNPTYHPGRCAAVAAGGRDVGVLGQLHPQVTENWGIDTEVYAAELCIEDLFPLVLSCRQYSPLPKYPAVSRDLAVTCAADTYVLRLEDAIRAAAGEALESLRLFDVYSGAQVGEGKKSVAFSLTLRHPDRTLTDAEADETVARILEQLKSSCCATLRA